MQIMAETTGILGSPVLQAESAGARIARFRHRDVLVDLAAEDAVPVVLNLSEHQQVAAWSGRAWYPAPPPEIGSVTVVDPLAHTRLRITGEADVAQIFLPLRMVDEALDADFVCLGQPLNSRSPGLTRAAVATFVAASLGDGALEAAVHDLVFAVARLAERRNRPVTGGLAPGPLRRVLLLIEEATDRGETPKVAQLAAEAGLSRFHFLRVFTETVGATPHAHILRRRSLAAARLMARDGTAAAQAAFCTGFPSAAHFGATFRRQVGVTPGRWQRAVRLD